MNIFYYSVHHILEDDEVRLLKSLGHNVFCLGINSKYGASEPYRPPIIFNETEISLYNIYESMGGKYFASPDPDHLFPPGFEQHFSVIIVMHSAGFIINHWHKIKTRPVIWRTIGQAMEDYERILAPFRRCGLHIVRYSPTELLVPETCGQDAIIRFYKNPEIFDTWTGSVNSILTFSNSFEQRYPSEAKAYRAITYNIPSTLGGGKNETFGQSIGFLSFEDQIDLYRRHRAYLYITGLEIPYTLNFMEAWMTGIPVIVYAPHERIGRYFEVSKLIDNGVTGFVCGNVEEAIECCRSLMDDFGLARRIGAAGRESAKKYFSSEMIGAQWATMLSRFDPDIINKI